MAQLCNPARTASDTDASYESNAYWYTEWTALANTEQRLCRHARENTHSHLTVG